MPFKALVFGLLLTFFGNVNSAGLPTLNTEVGLFPEYLGRWLVVVLWASDCPVCNREAQQYNDFHEFFDVDKATVLGISLDGENIDAALEYINKHEVLYTNFITDYQSGASWYERLTEQSFNGTPGFLIFDRQGKLRAQQIGAVPIEMIEQFIQKNDVN
jgi:peroxiredoxin